MYFIHISYYVISYMSYIYTISRVVVLVVLVIVIFIGGGWGGVLFTGPYLLKVQACAPLDEIPATQYRVSGQCLFIVSSMCFSTAMFEYKLQSTLWCECYQTNTLKSFV